MAIRFTKYIDIVSAVGANTVVAQRELIGRLFTTNLTVPPGSILEFDTAADVASYFGSASDEYKRAAFYFSFISKTANRPNKISFARWVDADVAARIYGARLTAALGAFNAISNGSFGLSIGGVSNVMSGLDFSAAVSFAAIATILQTAIRTKTGTQWTAATVTYDATRGGFNFVSGSAVAAVISVAVGGVGTDVSGLIGWYPESVNGAIWCNGALTETITEVLTTSTDLTNNFGSFLFMSTLSDDEVVEAASWNTAQQNINFQFCVRVADEATAELYGDPDTGLLINYSGVNMNYAPDSAEYDEMQSMILMASTDYNALNGTINYMYQIFNLTPKVTTTGLSNTLDSFRVNYYGRTQTAGQFVQFYQRGQLSGLPSAPVFANIYANEQWLKDAAAAAIMTLLLVLEKISANDEGRGQILTILQSVINQALLNGTISVGGILTPAQKLYIKQLTGDDKAWYQVQNIGYWIDCEIVPYQNDANITEYKADYTLVYKKDDVVNKVEGAHILI